MSGHIGIDSSIFNNFNGGLNTSSPLGIQTTSSNNILGDLGASGLSALTGGLSDLLTNILDIDLQTNINNVSKYGISSWGASSNPDLSEKQFNENVLPYVHPLLNNISESNLLDTINELEKYLTFIIELSKHQLRNHSRAGSTKAGRRKVIELATKLRKDTSRTMISNLEKEGISVTFKEKFISDSEITYVWSKVDNTFHQDNGYTYKIYNFKISNSIFSKNVNGKNKTNYFGFGLLSMLFLFLLNPNFKRKLKF